MDQGVHDLTFARNFFRNPRMLGSVIPSSRWLVDQLLRDIDWDRARVVVEFGPGVGTITREILERMRPDATLVAIDYASPGRKMTIVESMCERHLRVERTVHEIVITDPERHVGFVGFMAP